MSQPLVTAVMLTKDRPEMAARAVRCFRAQTYERKRLVIWDTSAARPFALSFTLPENERCVEDVPNYSIGELRNRALNWLAHLSDMQSDVIIHWDDDDVSSPTRIAEQVANLQASGAEAVGYRDLIFWDTRDRQFATRQLMPGEPAGYAWLWKRSPILGALPGSSLAFWRQTWERKPFPDCMVGEDTRWQAGLDVKHVSSIGADGVPRLVACVHGQNTSSRIPDRPCSQWARVPQFDAMVRGMVEA